VTYIENQDWKWHYGFSPMMEIPTKIQNELYKNKRDLWEVIQELSKKHDIKSNNWTFGELSDDIITRFDSFKISVKTAIAPFFNHFWK
jgi:non-canonical (house-cleaning) NTP pyrophosphatase